MRGYIHCSILSMQIFVPPGNEHLCVLQILDALWRGWPCWRFSWPVGRGKSCAYQYNHAFFLQIFWRNLVLWSSQEESGTSTSFTSCYLEHQMKHLVRDNKLLHALSLVLLHTALHMTIILLHGVVQSWGKRWLVHACVGRCNRRGNPE